MISMDVGFQAADKLQPELAKQRAVAAHLLEDGINEHGLAGFAATQQIGVGGGLRVDQLSEDQRHGFLAQPGGSGHKITAANDL
jgi:hypothetical protein